MDKRFDLAISFAGDERQIAERIANILSASGYNIFYDNFMKSELWGSELPVKLGEVYSKQARFCLMLVSTSYITKMWTNHERRYAIQEMLETNREYILPLKVEDVSVPGLPDTIGYITLDSHSINEICQLIVQKIGNPENSDKADISEKDIEIISEIISLCYTRAIFTKMDSEIRLVAMFESIEYTISQVRRLIPQIKSLFIQKLALEIITKLDSIERYRNIIKSEISNFIEPKQRDEIDSLKLDMIRNLHTLRREGRIMIQLPTTTMFEHFFSLDDANKKPQI